MIPIIFSKLIGESVNNYRVVSILGEGGMGAVYLAEHPFMGRKAAIKVLRRELVEDQRLVERFMNEARAANAIRHPNIIEILDVGRLPSGIPYLMMEFLDGEALSRRIARDRRMTVAAAADVAIQTASALFAAHGKGIVHRDLKPDNLFLIADPARRATRVKVLDFGIAKLRGELSGSGTKTQAGSFMGTPPYMSPEQCRGISDGIDHRTDIYALGIILYEMLAGAPPFASEGWGELAMMHMTLPPPPLRERNPSVPPEVEAVILKALAKRCEDRWSSMEALETALREVAPLAVAPPSPAPTGTPRQATVAIAASGGTELMPAPTTLRSAVGQIATDPAAVVPARPRWRRAAVLAGGAAVLAVGAMAITIGRRSSPEPAAEVESAPAAAVAPPAPAPPAPAPPPPAPVAPAARVVAPPVPAPEEPAPARGEVRIEAEAAAPSETRAKALRVGAKKISRRAEPRAEPQPPAPPAPPAAPAPRAKPASCDPNFYLDAQGEKHFKPECF